MKSANRAVAAMALAFGAACGSSAAGPGDGGGGDASDATGGSSSGDDGSSSGNPSSSGNTSSGSSGASSSSSDASSGTSSGDGSISVDYNVYQHHKSPSRDGVYIEPTFTKAAAKTMHMTTFMGLVTTEVYAQPLYVENGPGGVPVIVLATEENHVTVLNAMTGAVIWDKGPTVIGQPSTGGLAAGNGNIHPNLGITGTPYLDFNSGAGIIYFDAMTTPNNNTTHKHLVYALNLADGSTVKNWPVDVSAKITTFNSVGQNQRGALQLVNGVLYVPYGGHHGDNDTYYGWVVGFPLSNPQNPVGWHTTASKGGIWASGSLPTDGTSIFPVTGNTAGATTWGGGEAVIRLGAGPTFSGNTADYYAAYNWPQLDATDGDLGGASAVLFDMPSNPKPHLIAQGGKDRYLYILNRDNLGGIAANATSTHLLRQQVATGEINGAPAVYTTAMGTYVVFHLATGTGIGCPNAGGTGNLVAVRIIAGNPMTASVAWCANKSDLASPMVTTTDGSANAVVWAADANLWGYDGDTGLVIAGGPATLLPIGIETFNAPISAHGKMVVSGSGTLSILTP